MGQHGKSSGQLAGGLGFFRRGDQIDEGCLVHPPASLGCGDRKTDREMTFPDPWRPQEHDVLFATGRRKALRQISAELL